MTATPELTNDEILQQTQYRVYDSLLAAAFCLCLIIGLPGNSLALKYFVGVKKRSLPTLLYIAACSIDIVSSVIHIPVVINLVNGRKSGLLEDQNMCLVWYFVLILVQLLSMFVVMLITLTRAIVINLPFFKISTRAVLISIFLAVVYFSGWNVTYFILNEYLYSGETVYCSLQQEEDAKMGFPYMINYLVCSGIPPVIVFVALVVSIWKLLKTDVTDLSQRKNHQASVTMIYFAILYLFCNLLTLLNNVLYTVTQISDKEYDDFYKNHFMNFYSWPMSEVFCTVLNASLNPVLYLYRMKKMRAWIFGTVRRCKTAVVSSPRSYAITTTNFTVTAQ
ncbi:hypothetical protein ACHWQZ_G015350 [Mnemiopsis leidyi]